MLLEQKKREVENLKGIFSSCISGSIIFSYYRGMTVSDLTGLREEMRKDGAYFKVVKNTLARIAVEGCLGEDSLKSLMKGPVAMGYSEDPTAVPRILCKHAKNNENLVVLGGVCEGRVLSAEDVKSVADLPSLDDLRARILGVLSAPGTGIARILVEPGRRIAYLLASSDQGNS